MENPSRRQAKPGFEQLSFLPAVEFNPTWPAPSTLPGIVLARLLKGERLTQPSFGMECWRLAAYIKELDYMGWPVEAMDVPCPEGYGTGRPIREYWLSRQTLAAANGQEVQA